MGLLGPRPRCRDCHGYLQVVRGVPQPCARCAAVQRRDAAAVRVFDGFAEDVDRRYPAPPPVTR